MLPYFMLIKVSFAFPYCSDRFLCSSCENITCYSVEYVVVNEL